MARFKEALEAPVPADHGVLICLNRTGDTKVVFAYDDDIEVAHARDVFTKAREDGYVAFKMLADNQRVDRIPYVF